LRELDDHRQTAASWVTTSCRHHPRRDVHRDATDIAVAGRLDELTAELFDQPAPARFRASRGV
jgi:hypothetical protein